MDTYKISYKVEGVTYSFKCDFTIPQNDPRNDFVFLAAIDNDKEKWSLDGNVTDWDFVFLHTK